MYRKKCCGVAHRKVFNAKNRSPNPLSFRAHARNHDPSAAPQDDKKNFASSDLRVKIFNPFAIKFSVEKTKKYKMRSQNIFNRKNELKKKRINLMLKV